MCCCTRRRASGSTSPSSRAARRRRTWSGRTATTCAIARRASRWCWDARASRAVAASTRRHRSRRSKARFDVDAIEIGPDDDVLADGIARGRDGVHAARRAHGAVFARMGAAHLRRAGRHDPPDRARIHRPCARRRDDRDRGHDAALPAGRGEPRQDRQQRLGRLRMLLGAHDARRARRRARSAGRHARHHRTPQPPAVASGWRASRRARTAS